MSAFPNILHRSMYSTFLSDRQKSTPTPSKYGHSKEYQSPHQGDHQHSSALLINLLSHMFAPVSYQQCTSSAPCWTVSYDSKRELNSSGKTGIIVDDEFVLLEDRDGEDDGGPICREATIESWKAPKKAQKKSRKTRRWSDLPYIGCL